VNLEGIAKTAQIAAAISSIGLARKRAEHVPAALALIVLAAVPILRGPLRTVIEGPGGSELHTLIYVDRAAELATSAVVAGLAMAVAVTTKHIRRAYALAVLAWAVETIAIGIMSPAGRHELQRFYFAVDLFGLFVSAAALVRWGQRLTAAKLSPDTASVVALGLVGLDGAILLAPFSPWRGLVFGSDFSGIQLIIAVFFGGFTVVQMIVWRYSSRG
jgi:hypothetical protein